MKKPGKRKVYRIKDYHCSNSHPTIFDCAKVDCMTLIKRASKIIRTAWGRGIFPTNSSPPDWWIRDNMFDKFVKGVQGEEDSILSFLKGFGKKIIRVGATKVSRRAKKEKRRKERKRLEKLAVKSEENGKTEEEGKFKQSGKSGKKEKGEEKLIEL